MEGKFGGGLVDSEEGNQEANAVVQVKLDGGLDQDSRSNVRGR